MIFAKVLKMASLWEFTLEEGELICLSMVKYADNKAPFHSLEGDPKKFWGYCKEFTAYHLTNCSSFVL